MKMRMLVALLLGAIAFVVAGCGDDDESSSTTTI